MIGAERPAQCARNSQEKEAKVRRFHEDLKKKNFETITAPPNYTFPAYSTFGFSFYDCTKNLCHVFWYVFFITLIAIAIAISDDDDDGVTRLTRKKSRIPVTTGGGLRPPTKQLRYYGVLFSALQYISLSQSITQTHTSSVSVP
jgi:hypothetical protein